MQGGQTGYEEKVLDTVKRHRFETRAGSTTERKKKIGSDNSWKHSIFYFFDKIMNICYRYIQYMRTHVVYKCDYYRIKQGTRDNG